MKDNHEMHFGLEHYYLPTHAVEHDGEWIDTVNDDGLGIGD